MSTDTLLGVDRSLRQRHWVWRPADDRLANALSQRLGLPAILGRVLASREVDLAGAADFLAPRLRALLPNPSTLRDMDAGVARLAAAIRDGEPIGVFGDYDVDGATSTALLQRYFQRLGIAVRAYIPDRIAEGYGPNPQALRQLAAEGVKVLITVDCGIAAHAALQAGAEAGLDVIVVDHHRAEARLPPAAAVINPNRLDDDSGCGALAAVGVTFLLIVALNRRLRADGRFASQPEPDLREWLDLVALGTVCDVVPLRGLNRAFVGQGLKVMAQRRNPGLAALADVAGVNERIDAFHLGFMLGPRVNAGGRIGESELGARLLASDDAREVVAIAARLHELNAERRAIEDSVLQAARVQAEHAVAADDPPILVCAGRGWHPGVLGIVASRLVERFRRPALVIGLEGAVGKGSGRSLAGIDLGALVTAARQHGLLSAGGGHAMAAGLSLPEDKVEPLRDFLIARVDRGALRQVGWPLDGTLRVRAVDRALCDQVQQLGPFGQGHPQPRFAIADARIVTSKLVGGQHVSCIAAGPNGGRLRAIAFRSVDNDLGRTLLRPGDRPWHLAGHLRPDDWQGRRGVQLVVEDAAPAEATVRAAAEGA